MLNETKVRYIASHHMCFDNIDYIRVKQVPVTRPCTPEGAGTHHPGSSYGLGVRGATGSWEHPAMSRE